MSLTRRRPSRLSPLLGLLFVLSGCMPAVHPPGPAVFEPKLATAHFSAADGAVLPLRRWEPQRPIAAVVALHGFNDYSRAFARPGPFLAEHGIAVYAFDQRGFGNAPIRGQWAGLDAMAQDALDVVAAVRRRWPGLPVFLMGESMGAAVALVAATQPALRPVDGVVLIAPGVWGWDTMPWYQQWVLNLVAHTTPWLELTGSGLKIQACDDTEILREMWFDPRVIKATRVDAMYGLVELMDAALKRAEQLSLPTLVLYGGKDQVIPNEPVEQLLSRLPATPGNDSKRYPDGYHMLLRDKGGSQRMADLFQWIVKRAGTNAATLGDKVSGSNSADPLLPALTPNRKQTVAR